MGIWVNGKGTYTVGGNVFNGEDNVNGCDPYIETEVLSPLIELQPGAHFTFRIFWHCCMSDGDTIAAVNPLAVVTPYLVTRVENGHIRVNGSWGLLRTGILEIVTKNRSSNTNFVHPLGPAGPLASCAIDESIPYADSMV